VRGDASRVRGRVEADAAKRKWVFR
jgi:hypothetical protein